MARNGSGTYSLPSGNPVVTGSTISSTVHNTTMTDIGSEITNSIAKDGQTTPTADLPMGTYKHTGVGDATARTHYAKVSQIQDGGYITLSSVSGSDTITATVTPAITAYAAGQYFQFVSAGANTGAVTLNINSLGAKSITKEGTTALAAGDIASGAVVGVVYDGTRFQLVEGRSVQPLDTTLTALAGVLTAANKIPYATALNTAGELDLSTNTSLGTSDTTLSSQKAVKTYTDSAISTAVAAIPVQTNGTAQASTSGTSIDFTSIPATAKRISIMFDGVSTSGTSPIIVQIGDSGGVEATSYAGCASGLTTGLGTTNYTTGFGLTDDNAAARTHSGIAELVLMNASLNTWAFSSSVSVPGSTKTNIGSGVKSLSAALDRVRVTTVNGTDTFDLGSINILYQ